MIHAGNHNLRGIEQGSVHRNNLQFYQNKKPSTEDVETLSLRTQFA